MATPTAVITGADKVLDVRPVPCSLKHGLILSTWRELPVGDYFILLNNREPVPLRRQFEAEFPDTFAWEYLEAGPKHCRVKLTKLKALATAVETGKSYGCSGH